MKAILIYPIFISMMLLSTSCSTTSKYISKETVISASVDQAWAVIGEGYAEVDKWASTIPESKPVLRAGKLSGRTCETDIGLLKETITVYNPETHTIAYDAQSDQIPGFVEKLSNTWHLVPLGDSRTRVEMKLSAQLKPGFGPMWIPMKIQFNPLLEKTMEELKYYVESGRPHPRKLSAKQ